MAAADAFNAVAVSRDGKVVAAGGDGRVILVWDLVTGQRLASLDATDTVNALAFALDGRTVAFGAGGSGWIFLHDAATLQKRGRFWEPSNLTSSLTFSPDGKALASAARLR